MVGLMPAGVLTWIRTPERIDPSQLRDSAGFAPVFPPYLRELLTHGTGSAI
ncbi:MAG: hypothetical protein RLZZ611_2363 [Cyanobacteriota bacterium]|jgi:hypothetical protein